MNRLSRIFPKVDPFSLQTRLTIGVATFSALGLASLASWTSWKMQEILIDSHKENIKQIALRLPRDIEIYNDMLPVEIALQKAIDNRSDSNILLWVKSVDAKIIAKSTNFNLVSPSHVTELTSLSKMPITAEVNLINGRYFILYGEELKLKGRYLGKLSIVKDITNDQTMFIAMVKSLTVASILVIIIISLIIAIYIQRSLQPLRHISQMTAAIKPENLAETKVDLSNAPSEVKDLAKTVNMMLSRLSQAWEKERQFTSNISHELRTPLTIIYGYLQSMLRRKQNLTEIQLEVLETAASETENTIHILEELLDLARADSGYLRFNLGTYRINDLVNEAVEMAVKNSSRQIEIEVESDPIMVKVDHQYFIQVLLNLIDNGVKYSDPDTKITIKLKRSENKGIIQVCDRGHGITLQHQSRIFDRFYRIDEARTRSAGSTGLGLSIVKTLVEGMGGNVTVSSQVGEGSVFTVSLPRLPDNTSDN
ncbi:ATP-binding protein [Calothrix sp. PCC 6303]|uniref:sensor histidine kinase n=1 Tax=Calothrix sp. PCC 6303 TaxID=1170562 RepID=UPI0002A04F9F|nr:ATP-binding protein [Calothrix sp. PCC 6303]AFZ02175.1 integral membrane sensor signal transduction histidine kinase [Calothrix sp. PCC 6303]